MEPRGTGEDAEMARKRWQDKVFKDRVGVFWRPLVDLLYILDVLSYICSVEWVQPTKNETEWMFH